MNQHKTALILGATGGIGGEMAKGLLAAGWTVRALHRNPDAIRKPVPAGIEWRRGDAMHRADVVAAATGAALIVHGVNPPRYHNWPGLALPMLDNTVAAAQAAGALIFFPGTVYNFGPDTFPLVAEDAPQRPVTRKGAVRVEMEARLRAACDNGARVLILRGGDFFGPDCIGNSWFGGAIVKAGKPLRSVTYPGRPDAGHTWAYLPDFARAALLLIARNAELPPFAVFHFQGHWFERGADILDAIRAAAGNRRLPQRRFPWWLIRVASPFVESFREMQEMTYLWRVPLRLDNRRLVAFLGAEPHTPTIEAVRISLLGLGCLPDPAAATSKAAPAPA